ncbi:MAG: DinB family protein [Bacteroidia bacterium]|jgi:oxepin-CoA hydrolase/3-oxo-5,6-dehydrosuberyl-CoA semialdehyde dehydrogenase
MKTAEEIEFYLRNRLIHQLGAIPENTPALWGTMNVRQMIEHLAWPFKASNGSFTMPQTTPEDKLERVKAIGLLNDRPMQHNFQNPIYTDEYKQLRNANIEAALIELQNDIDLFVSSFKSQDPSFTRMHNIFGPLNFHEWLQFHFKHCMHHLEQFGVEIDC